MIEPTAGDKVKVRKRNRYNWSAMKEGDIMVSKSPLLTTAKSWAKNNEPGWKFSSTKDGELFIVKRVA